MKVVSKGKTLNPETLRIRTLFFVLSFCTFARGEVLQVGEQLQTLSNLHPDAANHVLYTLNYQQDGMIPVCSDIKVTSIKKKTMKFLYGGIVYTFKYDGHTNEAGISFKEALENFFGRACDSEKIASLNEIDQEGIALGKPLIGMSKSAVLFAMGRPPHHVNPHLSESYYWIYWRNRYGKRAIEFGVDGTVVLVK